jgi:1-acyl-sn-glycerol-3-phosphate acyltransferase
MRRESVMAARSPAVSWLMTQYSRYYTWRHFHAVRLARGTMPVVDRTSSVIVYSNHPSWWDPLAFVLLQRAAFGDRIGFGPMESQSLGRYGVLKRIGIFGVDPDTRGGALRFLRAGAEILGEPGTVLWVTAEGKFTDPRDRPVRLRPGVAHLMRGRRNVVAIPLAMEFPFWNERTPELLLRFGQPLIADPEQDVDAWQAMLVQRLTETMDCLAADSVARDPGRFQKLQAGTAGIGGVYDVWRRARSLLRGERPWLEHERP